MRDVEDGDPFAAQLAEQPGQGADLVAGQRGGRLVEDQDPRPAEQRLGDLHQLAAPERQLLHRPVESDVETDPCADGMSLGGEPAIVDEAATDRDRPQRHVLGDREMRRQAELLLHHGDAVPARFGRGQRRVRPAVDLDAAGVRPQHAREQVDEGRLAGAVLAQQGLHAARADLDRDLLEDRVAEEPLGEPARGENRRRVAAHFLAAISWSNRSRL
jgi:hypothetical protein